MKSKFAMLLTIMLCVFFVSGCGSGEELFTEEFCSGITEIIYMDYQENEIVYTDEESISIVANALKKGRYEKTEDSYLAPGTYDFIIIVDGKKVRFSYSGDNLLGYGESVYKIHNNHFGDLISLVPGIKNIF